MNNIDPLPYFHSIYIFFSFIFPYRGGGTCRLLLPVTNLCLFLVLDSMLGLLEGENRPLDDVVTPFDS